MKKIFIIKNLSIILTIAIIWQLFSLVNFFPPTVTQAQSQGSNLVQNPGFEEITASEPSHWISTVYSQTCTKSIDAQNKHSGNYSWKFTNPNGVAWCIAAFSNFIEASRGDFFALSAWAKTSSGNQYIRIGINERRVKTDGTFDDSFYYFFKDKTEVASQPWTQYLKSRAIAHSKTRYIRFVIGGPYDSQGSVWFDDIEIIKNEPTHYGCQNISTARCLDFGAYDDLAWIPSSYQSNLGPIISEGNTNYRVLSSAESTNKQVVINIPAFDVDQSGFPNSDLMLEIRYKDIISTSDDKRPRILSHIGFTLPTVGINKDWEILDSLEFVNDERWKVTQIPLPKTPWQRLRSLNGVYGIDLWMPNVSDLTLPIDYLSLTSISHQDYLSYVQWLRDRRSLRQVNYTETNPIPSFNGDITWFVRPLEQLVFSNTIPTASEIEKPISVVTARDEYEPLVFSLYAKQTFNDLRFEVSDFTNFTNNDVISSSNNVTLNKVIYDTRYWTSRWIDSTYGLMPDYLEKSSSLNINHNSSQQLWFILKVPDTAKGGHYAGTIKLNGPNGLLKTIPISINVLALKLSLPNHDNILYNMPFTKIYSMDMKKVFQDFRSHDINGISTIRTTFSYNSTSGLSYDTTLFEQQLDEAITKGVITRRAYYLSLDAHARQIAKLIYNDNQTWTTDLYWQVVEWPSFKTAFRRFIRDLIAIGAERNIELVFQVIDEPGIDWVRRLSSDRLYRLIRAEGGKTWVTYYEICDQRLECTATECQYSPDNIREDGKIYIPPLSNLVDYKVYAASYIKNANRQLDPDSYAYYTTYYSQIRNPIYNRFLHGLFAVKNDVKVVANYAYGDYVGDPYNDFDPSYLYAFPSSTYDYLLAYPTWTGEMLPTLAFEGTREGIKDAKYITTLKNLIAQFPNDPISSQAQAYLNTVLAHISTEWVTDYINQQNDFGFANIILGKVSTTGSQTDYSAFNAFRTRIAGYIEQLNNHLLVQKMVTVTSNTRYITYDNILIYTVAFTNKTARSMSNIVLTNPIPERTEYIEGSVTNHGIFANNKITWNVSSLPVNGTFAGQFSVKVR